MRKDGQAPGSEALASATRSELWAANHLGAAALERLWACDEVPVAQLACVRQAAEALIVAVAPVVSNGQLVKHVVGVAHELHGR